MTEPEPLPDPRPLPMGARAGVGTIVFGLLLDLTEHALPISGAAPSPGQHLAHLVVLIGMLLVLAAIVRDGIGTSRRVDRRNRRALHAIR